MFETQYDLRSLCVPPDATLLQVLSAIDSGARGIALVLGEDGRLVATATDGDVRRALLKGAGLGDPLAPHVQRSFVSVGPRAGRAEVLDLMRARSLLQVPVVDGDGRLAGLHMLRELIGAAERPNWAVIMAGGEGRRLGGLTQETPKPMLQVAGRPILERLVLHLVGHGVRRIFLAVRYLSHVIKEHFGSGEQFGCRIEYLEEDQPLGTAGALSLLPERPGQPLLVLNGDLVTQFDAGEFLEAHARGGDEVSLGVRPFVYTVPFGVVEARQGKVLALREKPSEEWLVNAGIYVLAPRALDRVTPSQALDMTTLIERCLTDGGEVGLIQLEEDWIDVGRLEELARARTGEGEERV